jgi:hypothetical protein
LVCHSAAAWFVIPQRLCLSFRSDFVCHSAATLFVIPQRSEGICFSPFDDGTHCDENGYNFARSSSPDAPALITL